MLTDEEFLAFLNDKELDGSLEENLSKIIDDEMEKPEEEMDTEQSGLLCALFSEGGTLCPLICA